MVNNNDTVTMPRSVVEQALEALTNCTSEYSHRCNRCDSEVDPDGNVASVLRAALDQPQVELDPVAYEYVEHRPYGAPGEIRRGAILMEHYRNADGNIAGDWEWLVKQFMVSKNTISMRPLYTHPQPSEQGTKNVYTRTYSQSSPRSRCC